MQYDKPRTPRQPQQATRSPVGRCRTSKRSFCLKEVLASACSEKQEQADCKPQFCFVFGNPIFYERAGVKLALLPRAAWVEVTARACFQSLWRFEEAIAREVHLARTRVVAIARKDERYEKRAGVGLWVEGA